MPNPHPHNTRQPRRFPPGCGEKPGRPGLFYVRYVDAEGRRRDRYTRDYDELLRLHRELAGPRARSVRPVAHDRRQTVGALLDAWLLDVANRVASGYLRPRTLQGYREQSRYLVTALGTIRLVVLSRPDVERLVAELRDPDLGLSDSTVRGAFNALKVALNWAVGAGLLERNPIEHMKPPAVTDIAIVPPSRDEVAAFLAAATGHRLEALFIAAARSGLRQGELLALRWADVASLDTARPVIEVRATLERDTRRRAPTKTEASSATVPMAPTVAAALRAHRLRQLDERRARLAKRRGWREPELVFTTDEGRALDGRAVTRTLHRVQDRHGLRRFRFHDLRHYLASDLLGRGASIYDVQATLRHSRIGTTIDQYGHRTPEQAARIRGLLDAIGAS